MSENENNFVEIPEDIYIRCPKESYQLTPFKKCEDCESFSGLTQHYPLEQKPFHIAFKGQCNYVPVDRELLQLKVNHGRHH